MECAEGKKYFQPSLAFIDSGRRERWHIHAHQTQPRGSFVDLTVHVAHSFLHFASTICCSLFLRSTQIKGLFGLSRTRQTWMRCFFSVNKSPPSEVERSEYFPELGSKPLTIHTCPSCSENEKHSMGAQWKNENYGFAQIRKTSKPGSQTHQLNMINHVNSGLFNVYF